MKRIAAAALLLASTTPAWSADYPTTVLATDPLAYFRLTSPSEGSLVGGYTTTYTETTGTGPGAPIASDPGNTGATFAGNNDAPSKVTTSLSGGIAGKGSINLWVNLSALPSTLGHIFTLAGESQSGNDFDFQIETDNHLRFYTGSSENTAFDLGSTKLLGKWHMLTASYDATLGASGYRDLYLDGVEVASYDGLVSGGTKTNPFVIGYSDVFTGRDFAGTIDEVAVWGRGLSADEIRSIYDARLDPGTPAEPAVPEPASWAMMIAGFGLVGSSLRRRHVRMAIA